MLGLFASWELCLSHFSGTTDSLSWEKKNTARLLCVGRKLCPHHESQPISPLSIFLNWITAMWPGGKMLVKDISSSRIHLKCPCMIGDLYSEDSKVLSKMNAMIYKKVCHRWGYGDATATGLWLWGSHQCSILVEDFDYKLEMSIHPSIIHLSIHLYR